MSSVEYDLEKIINQNKIDIDGILKDFDDKQKYSAMKEPSNVISSADINQEPPQPIEKRVIMAVDDMPGLLSTIVKFLQDRYTVLAATNAITALKVIEKQDPELFLLDIEMPDVNGYELAMLIRANPKFAATPIIFLTAKNTRDDVITAVQFGGNDYIVKPVDKDVLIDKIQRYLP